MDTSVLIDVKSAIPHAARAAVFEAFSRLVADGRLVFPPQVVKELKHDSASRPDAACQWALSVEATACAVVPSLDDVKAVLAIVPDILDPKKDSGADEADPYVIALARKLLDEGHDARVVVQETKDTPTKLSLNTACGMLRVPSVPLRGLLRVEGIASGAEQGGT